MKPKIKLSVNPDPNIKTAARSTAEILLVAAAAKVAVSKCLETNKVPCAPFPPMPALTQFLLTRDVTFGLKMNAQILFALGESLEKFVGNGRKPTQPTIVEKTIEEVVPVEENSEEPIAEEEPISDAVPEEPIQENTEEIAEEPAEETLQESATEEIAEAPAEEEIVAEEPVVEAMAPVAVAEEEMTEERDEPAFADGETLEYIDVKDEPEAYAALLARAEAGEVQLVTRYRQSYESRLVQAKDTVQEYYSGIKNALLAYKGVKSRISWTNETFRQGRNHVAKIIVKPSSLYVYFALDPEQLAGTKYESAVTILSGRKKFETVPVLIKIKGERKYKYALDMIAMVCGDKLQLPPNKKFEETDYKRPAQTMDELVDSGLVRKLVAGAPIEESAE